MLRVIELFGGIGACTKALERLNIPHEVVDYVEIDKYAVKSFNAVHGTNFEPQDITKWDKDLECDLIMHGSPCQDFSIAGKQAGGDDGSGTRSSLMYETLRIVEKLKPKYVIWENVKNLLSKKHRHNFDAYQEAMKELGYINYYQVLNAKDYGIPQNRERVFTISIRKDVSDKEFIFPEPMTLERMLKDMLEDKVDEKYYLNDKLMKTYQRNFGSKGKELTGDISPTLTASMGGGGANTPYFDECKMVGRVNGINGHDYLKRVYDGNGCSPTLPTCSGGNIQPKVIEPFVVASRGRGENNEQHLEPRFDGTTNTLTSVQKDNYVAELDFLGGIGEKDLVGDGKKLSRNYPQVNRVYSVNGIATSQTANGGGIGGKTGLYALNEQYRIRKLTPKECWRLMGFDDVDFEKAEKVNSNTQLYKQAGNSIVVNVLEAILSRMEGIINAN